LSIDWSRDILSIAALLFIGQSRFDAILQKGEESLDVSEGSCGIVVVAHKAVLVGFRVGCDIVDDEPSLLHGTAAMLKVAAHFVSGPLQRAIETKSMGFRGAIARIGAVPL
jgi:hypothetical protein